jgi:hypothetical protein
MTCRTDHLEGAAPWSDDWALLRCPRVRTCPPRTKSRAASRHVPTPAVGYGLAAFQDAESDLACCAASLSYDFPVVRSQIWRGMPAVWSRSSDTAVAPNAASVRRESESRIPTTSGASWGAVVVGPSSAVMRLSTLTCARWVRSRSRGVTDDAEVAPSRVRSTSLAGSDAVSWILQRERTHLRRRSGVATRRAAVETALVRWVPTSCASVPKTTDDEQVLHVAAGGQVVR